MNALNDIAGKAAGASLRNSEKIGGFMLDEDTFNKCVDDSTAIILVAIEKGNKPKDKIIATLHKTCEEYEDRLRKFQSRAAQPQEWDDTRRLETLHRIAKKVALEAWQLFRERMISGETFSKEIIAVIVESMQRLSEEELSKFDATLKLRAAMQDARPSSSPITPA